MADTSEPLPDPADVWPPPIAGRPTLVASAKRFLFWSLWLDLPLGFLFGLFSFPLLTFGLLLTLALARINPGVWERPWHIVVGCLIAGALHLLLFRGTRRRYPAFASSALVGALLAGLLTLLEITSSLRS